MDAWSGDQLKRMQLGGNDALNGFFLKYGVEKTMDIKEKYNTKVAEVRNTGALLFYVPALTGSRRGRQSTQGLRQGYI
jgi:ADP-ribosylation factor GTPase-activating protein 1